MKTVIYHYSGTGNSFWTARRLSEKISGAELVPINFMDTSPSAEADAVGMVFPVHIWGVPGKILKFIELFPDNDDRFYFALAVNGGQVAATLKQLKRVLGSKGISLCLGYDITMPSNYIPWGGPGPEEKVQGRFRNAEKRITAIAEDIKAGKKLPVEKGPLWQNILFSLLYRMSLPNVHRMDGAFWVDEKCTSCGICGKICPEKNIEMAEGKPIWLNRCEQCLACIQWCPEEAIQYGKKTPQYRRYHHPGVTLKDMLDTVPK